MIVKDRVKLPTLRAPKRLTDVNSRDGNSLREESFKHPHLIATGKSGQGWCIPNPGHVFLHTAWWRDHEGRVSLDFKDLTGQRQVLGYRHAHLFADLFGGEGDVPDL